MRVNRKPVPTTGDEQTERAILAIILASDPMALTIPELTREFGGDKDKVIKPSAAWPTTACSNSKAPRPNRCGQLPPLAAATDWTTGEPR
jgi:hypothetical protein